MKALLIIAVLLLPTIAMSRDIPEDLTCSELHVYKEKMILTLMQKMYILGLMSDKKKDMTPEELVQASQEIATNHYWPFRVTILSDCESAYKGILYTD